MKSIKGLNVLKKHWHNSRLLLATLLCSTLWADNLAEVLSPQKRDIFEYQLERNELESNQLKKSWISPLTLSWQKNYTTQFGDDAIDTSNFTVSIDQPIFKSGGIFFSVIYAEALRGANEADIELARRQMIGSAVTILYNLQKSDLLAQKQKLLIANDEIDIRFKSDSYEAGLLDSSFLDQAILKRNADQTQLLAIELELHQLRAEFGYLSDKDPEALELPKLKLVSKENYASEHLVLRSETLRAEEKKNYSRMTWAKYLPEVSLYGQYNNGDRNPLFNNASIKEEYNTYGIRVSMPININSLSDVEASRVAYLEAATRVIDQRHRVELEYTTILNRLGIIDKRIALARKDEKLYRRLLEVTRNLEEAGEKTRYDTELMQNSLLIRKLDQQIYAIDRQIQLLDLYIKVNRVL
jgi:outer membrane protein TolC